MNITELTVHELQEKLVNKEISITDITKAYVDRINEKENDVQAFLEIQEKEALEKAKEIEEKVEKGEIQGNLAGIPIGIKDNMCVKGTKTTCASKMLENFVAPYNATVIEKLNEENIISLGKTNMDEFAMGSSTENSAFGVTHNPLDFDRVPGGSSGGSACAVALNLCPISLGTETGGSVRQPASYCGIYGLKPTYGRISRYGVVAFASSLDQVGIFSKTLEDNALMLEVLAGQDKNDGTSSSEVVDNYVDEINKIASKVTVGVPKEILSMCKDMPCENNFKNFIDFLKNNGITIKEVSVKDVELGLATYYILSPAEATSNLARFDGVKYTSRSEEATNLQEIYKMSRSEGFGKEVKRRIMQGNYVLSSGYFDAYYNKAKKIQGLLIKEYEDALKECDIIIMPTTIGEAYKIGSKPSDPVETYKEDIFTVTANIAGLPSLNIPFGKGENGLPLGIQLMSKKFNEKEIYQLAKFIETKRGND